MWWLWWDDDDNNEFEIKSSQFCVNEAEVNAKFDPRYGIVSVAQPISPKQNWLRIYLFSLFSVEFIKCHLFIRLTWLSIHGQFLVQKLIVDCGVVLLYYSSLSVLSRSCFAVEKPWSIEYLRESLSRRQLLTNFMPNDGIYLVDSVCYRSFPFMIL